LRNYEKEAILEKMYIIKTIFIHLLKFYSYKTVIH